MSIIVALLIFGLLIFFHELGHFLLAKRGGIGVTAFSLGMGPAILKKKIGETEYCLRIFPFGGSCAMVGEDEESDAENAFNKKGVWTRISVVAAGPFFNFVLAFAGSIIMVCAVGVDKPVITEMMEGYPAYEAGVRAGDEIISMNGRNIGVYRDVSMYIQLHQGEAIDLVYERNGERYETTILPKMSEDGYYLMGITGGAYTKCDNPIEVIKYAGCEVGYWIHMVFDSLKMMVTGQVSREDVGGPVRIVSMIGDTYEQSAAISGFAVFINMLNMVIFLSANLGVMNLLPIPALDGGRLFIMLIEVITRKRVPEKVEGYIHMAGFAVLMSLMVLILFNDISLMFFNN
ncbi:MAG: RIP metalloprotease RseP [Lachnospiraceae bacterium]|nr:RIP metalloprotease RseP [Lachnospiraceae bacterium]